jgi:hypothetical protein
LTWYENQKILFRKKNIEKFKIGYNTCGAWTNIQKKIVHENDSLELKTIEVFDNKFIDGAIIIQGDLVSIKCYVWYWRHFAYRKH